MAGPTSCWKIVKSRAQCSHESQHREVTRFHDCPCFDFANRQHGYSSAGRELLLSQSCLFADGAKPRCQSHGLLAEAAFSASPTSPTDHTVSLEVNLYQ